MTKQDDIKWLADILGSIENVERLQDLFVPVLKKRHQEYESLVSYEDITDSVQLHPDYNMIAVDYLATLKAKKIISSVLKKVQEKLGDEKKKEKVVFK